MRHHGDEPALLPVIQRDLVRHLRGHSAARKISVVHADERKPMSGLIVHAPHDPQIRTVAKITELARQDALALLAG
jgi:hypothetical protein